MPQDASTVAFWQPIQQQLIRIRRISGASAPADFGLLAQRFGCGYAEFLLLDDETVRAAHQARLRLNAIGKIDAKGFASI